MIFEDEFHKSVVITTYDNYLNIYLWTDDVSFNFMTSACNSYFRDNFETLKTDVFNKDMIIAVDLSYEDILKLINILKNVIETRLSISPVYSEGYHPYSDIVLETKKTGFNYDAPIYTLGVRAKDNITPYIVDFLGNKMFDLQYSYNELLEIIEQWEKIIS